jgi:Arc/MetJ-type ribon-helix-helix transcriptional regulator
MESQLTVRIPLSLAEKLEQVARESHRKRSDLVRMALEEFLGDRGEPLETRPYDRVRDLLGSVESGIPDLGQNHREHLLQRLKSAR